ncbi:MAG: ketopantoate reductase family protein [Agromyces sp.]
MRIGVIGAGALGGLLAARLQLAGHDVQVITRGTQRDTIAAHGITLRGGYGEATVRVSVVDSFDAIDLCLVCVKVHDTAEALSEYGPSIGAAPTVLVQNGIDGQRIAQQYLNPDQLFGAVCLVAANYTEDGLVTVTNPQQTLVGRGSGAADSESVRIASILNEAIPTQAVDGFTGVMWTKLIFNMQNALPAITGLSVQDVAKDRYLRTLLAAAMREAARIGIALHVPFGPLPGLDAHIIRTIARSPLWRTRRMVAASARQMGPHPNLASMLQSIRRGRHTEIEFLNGAVVRAAESIGLDAPLNRALTALVHDLEATGQHLTSRELRIALREHGVRV